MCHDGSVRGVGALWRALFVIVALLGVLSAAAVSAVTASTDHGHPVRHKAAAAAQPPPTTVPPSTSTSTTAPARPAATAPAASPSTTTSAPAVTRTAVATLAGCPPPPHAPEPTSPPWHPSVLVPDSQLPPVASPAAWKSDLTPLRGTGMWIWQWQYTDGGDPAAVVAQARASHLGQLWVRVGDSLNGFYGAAELNELVPAAHAAGLAVIAWGFPYLYDPVGDARWTAKVLAWHTPDGQTVDGYSADIERPSEGVDLTARRTAVYLQAVRRVAGSRLVVATVYPPTDANWQSGGYPYTAIAPYVDAFAPMIYWECTDPGTDATGDVARLATLRPVHVIGQAFNLADVGGRAVAPSGAEIDEFLQASEKAGALGGSLWVWQDADPQEWAAIGGYRW